jgi:hypothetical protein
MPWKIQKDGEEFCVYKEDDKGEPEGKSLGCHPDQAGAKKQLAALYASESGKAASVAIYFEAMIHMNFTDMADRAFADGWLTREERIGLSGGIGKALEAFAAFLAGAQNLAALQSRKPFQNTEEPMAVEGTLRSAPDHLVKSLGEDRVGGYLIIFGEPRTKDVVGNWFTPETAHVDDVFKAVGALPLMYHHAMDGAVRSDPAGVIDVLKKDSIGWWMEAQLRAANRYASAIKELVRRGVLGLSSGAMPQPGVEKFAPNGAVINWVAAEGSLTPIPADPRQLLERPVKELKAIFDECGLSLPKELMPPEPDAPEGAEEARLKALLQQESELLKLVEI